MLLSPAFHQPRTFCISALYSHCNKVFPSPSPGLCFRHTVGVIIPGSDVAARDQQALSRSPGGFDALAAGNQAVLTISSIHGRPIGTTTILYTQIPGGSTLTASAVFVNGGAGQHYSARSAAVLDRDVLGKAFTSSWRFRSFARSAEALPGLRDILMIKASATPRSACGIAY